MDPQSLVLRPRALEASQPDSSSFLVCPSPSITSNLPKRIPRALDCPDPSAWNLSPSTLLGVPVLPCSSRCSFQPRGTHRIVQASVFLIQHASRPTLEARSAALLL